MYLGSVRFFRHVILTVLVLLVALSAFFAIHFGIKYNESVSKLAEVQEVMNQYGKSGQDKLDPNFSQLLNNSPDKQIPSVQQQIDSAMKLQLNTLYAQINDDIDKQVSLIKKELEQSLTGQLNSLKTSETQTQQQLNKETAQLGKKIDDENAAIMQRLDALKAEITALTLMMNKKDGIQNGK